MTTRRRWSAKTRMEILSEHQEKCCICGQPIERDKGFDLDHLIPLRIGGPDTRDNLRPAHRACHRIKTKSDHAQIGKTRRQEAKSWGVKSQKGPKLQSRGFPKADAQPGRFQRHEALLEAAKAKSGKAPLARRPMFERMP